MPDGSIEKPVNVRVRSAHLADAPAIAELMGSLGYPSDPDQTARRLAIYLAELRSAVFVAECRAELAGAISFHCIPMFHVDGFLGRITSLIVSATYRRQGVGRALVQQAEIFGWEHGCVRMEVTSGDHRPEAHAFYERQGYRFDCRRFVKVSMKG